MYKAKYMCYTCHVPQLNLYVPEKTARQLRARAKARGLSLSKYLASIAARSAAVSWPPGYFQNALGAWHGRLKRPHQLRFEKRDTF